jgi:hypothetical protein
MRLRLRAPRWGFASTFVIGVLVCGGVVSAQPKKTPLKADKTGSAPTARAKAGETKKPPKEQNFNFDNLNLNGRSHSPQLLYFLERANEELERASLEKRSFIPHMVRTVEEEAL